LIKIPENIDFLAEVIASHLQSVNKIGEPNLNVHLLGIFRRFYSNDVEKIYKTHNSLNEEEWNLCLNRDGFYDILPEGFFHSYDRKNHRELRETLEEIRRYKREENYARKFFSPLEKEFFNQLVQKELFEQNFFYSPETIQEFIEFYTLDRFDLSVYQKAALFFIMPFVSAISGSIDLTQSCVEVILQEKVHICCQYEPMTAFFENVAPDLGNVYLGRDSTLGYAFLDGNPGLKITIGPLLQRDSLLSYLEGKSRKLVEVLADLFIQADLIVTIDILLNESDQHFTFSDKEYEGRLNYSTFI
jgi:hypothetical protein